LSEGDTCRRIEGDNEGDIAAVTALTNWTGPWLGVYAHLRA
jgi:hypothetical protein